MSTSRRPTPSVGHQDLTRKIQMDRGKRNCVTNQHSPETPSAVEPRAIWHVRSETVALSHPEGLGYGGPQQDQISPMILLDILTTTVPFRGNLRNIGEACTNQHTRFD